MPTVAEVKALVKVIATHLNGLPQSIPPGMKEDKIWMAMHQKKVRQLMKPLTGILMQFLGKIVEMLPTVCNIFAKESWDWVMFVLIYLGLIRQMVFLWILSK